MHTNYRFEKSDYMKVSQKDFSQETKNFISLVAISIEDSKI